MSNEIELFENHHALNLIDFIKNTSEAIDVSYCSNEIILKNEHIRLTYRLHDLEATNALCLDLFVQAPGYHTIRISGAVSCHHFLLSEFNSFEILFLSSDPQNDNEDCYVVAETSLDSNITLEDFDGDEKFYNIIKSIEALGKQARDGVYIKPNKGWFSHANYLLYFVSNKYNFPYYYKEFIHTKIPHGVSLGM